jgi:hypothetical protein
MEPIVSRMLSVHKEHEVLLRLEAAGMGDAEAQRLIQSKDNALAKKIVIFIRRGGFNVPTTFKHAREVMGKNFISPTHVEKHFQVQYGNRITNFWEIPYPESVLTECKNTHILFAGYPLTIREMCARTSKDLFPFMSNYWWEDLAFAKADKVKLRWYLIRKGLFPNSRNKTITEQVKMLSEYEEVPRACEVMYMTILSGERLFLDVYARCRDSAKKGGRVSVSTYPDGGIGMTSHAIGNPIVGTASSRKISV